MMTASYRRELPVEFTGRFTTLPALIERISGFEAQLNQRLQLDFARIDTITTMKMKNGMNKTGYAQMEVKDAYGRKAKEVLHKELQNSVKGNGSFLPVQ